jgi:hypothetical protein
MRAGALNRFGDLGRDRALRLKTRSHERGTILSGASLAAESDLTRGAESRLKAGCSLDWLPHKRRLAEHQMLCSHAEESAKGLRGEIARYFAPRQPALRSVGQRHGGIESRAIATFPPARRSPMMPEPTTAASSSAVPTASAVMRRVRVTRSSPERNSLRASWRG